MITKFTVICLSVLLICSAFVFSFSKNKTPHPVDNKDDVARIFQKSCGTTGCHSGKFPPKELNLEEDKFFDSLVNRDSQEQRGLRLVDTEKPEKSYLLMKIKGDPGIEGKRMPLDRDPLDEGEITVIEKWIADLGGKGLMDSESERVPNVDKGAVEKPAFWGTQLVNLPTDRSIGDNSFLFRISHRFLQPADEGYAAFYGLDGPAVIMFSLGYGISDHMDLSLGYSNRFKEADLSFKWVLFSQNRTSRIPITGFINAGWGWITEQTPDRDTFSSGNMRYYIQLGLSHRINDAFSLLVVPSYTSNTLHYEDSKEGTFALGIGGRFMFINDLSLILEWNPVISGVKLDESGWGLGLEYKIGGHVFQIYALNTFGLASAQYLPGGDLRLSDGDFRFGFNILRWF